MLEEEIAYVIVHRK